SRGFDLVANALQRGGHALRGKQAGYRDVLPGEAGNHPVQRVTLEQLVECSTVKPELPVVTSIVVRVEIVEVVSWFNRFSGRVMYAVGSHKKIVGVLIQVLIRFDEQRQGGRVPNHLIDADDVERPVVMLLVAIAVIVKIPPQRKAAVQLNQKHGVAVHSAGI